MATLMQGLSTIITLEWIKIDTEVYYNASAKCYGIIGSSTLVCMAWLIGHE